MQSPAFWPGFFANTSAVGPQATARKNIADGGGTAATLCQTNPD